MTDLTEKYYFKDMQCLEIEANIVAIDSENAGLVLDKTIFHVKGGGQLADSGTINGISVLGVFLGENGQILHTVDKENLSKFSLKQTVNLSVDANIRQYHSRLHSAGHLLAGVVEKLYPALKAISGHHFPGQCRVVFKGSTFPNKERFIPEVEAALNAAIETNSNVSVEKGKDNLRMLNFEGFHIAPCGGTHVTRLGELGQITIRKFSVKGDQLAVGYEIAV